MLRDRRRGAVVARRLGSTVIRLDEQNNVVQYQRGQRDQQRLVNGERVEQSNGELFAHWARQALQVQQIVAIPADRTILYELHQRDVLQVDSIAVQNDDEQRQQGVHNDQAHQPGETERGQIGEYEQCTQAADQDERVDQQIQQEDRLHQLDGPTEVVLQADQFAFYLMQLSRVCRRTQAKGLVKRR